MEEILLCMALMLFGAALGSFAGAQVWRLRARQLVDDKKSGYKVSKKEYERLGGLVRSAKSDRSECLHCHHRLAWYDMMPVVSWLTLGGKCRYCRKSIGIMEVLVEVGLGAAFALSYMYWPFTLDSSLEWLRFALWLVVCALMAILFVYDAKWSLLPFSINLALIAVALSYMVTSFLIAPFAPGEWLSLVVAVAMLAGLYFLFSIPGWVGLGDSILGLGLALLLIRWEWAFLALFLANLLGCFMLIPLAVRGKLSRGTHVPFGPLLITGAFVAVLWGSDIMSFVFDGLGLFTNTLML